MKFLRTSKTPTLPTEPVEYPSGICVETESGKYLIHRDGKRYKIPSEEVYRSWRFPLTVKAHESALVNYPVALTRLVFRDGTLIYNIKDARIYLVSEGKKRHVTSPAVLSRLGATEADVMVVADSDAQLMKVGEEIT